MFAEKFGNKRLTPDGGARRGEEGFALALVVLLLFAIAMMGAAGYQMVRTEFIQAQHAAENGQALAVAQGGLRWFMGSHRGLVPDSTGYSINGGTATITTRKVATLSEAEDLYLVRCRGEYTDPRLPQVPATRTVAQYATFRKIPMNGVAPVMTTAGRWRVRGSSYPGYVTGVDQATSGQCAGAPRATIAGALSRTQVTTSGSGTVVGSPTGITLGSFQNVVDSVDLDWNIYSDPTFPVDYDDTWPNFSSLPSDSFPVVRVTGNFSPNWSKWGRGVLIITGELRIPSFSFWSWNGIVMAGDVQNVGGWDFFTIYGALVAGMGSSMGNVDMDNGGIYYHSCYVYWAGLSLSHLTPLENGWWEES